MFQQSTAVQKSAGNTGNKNKQDFGACEPGQDVGRIVRVIGYGLQDVSNKFNPDADPATVIQVTVELPNQRINYEDKEGNTQERPRWVWGKDIPVKFFKDFDTGVTRLHEKSKLHELMTAVFPKIQSWTPELVEEYFPQLLGAQVSVFIVNNESKKTGKVYDGIKQYMPVMRGMTVPELENDTLWYDPYNHDEEAFQKLAPFMQERIKNRLDAGNGSTSEPKQAPESAQPEPQPSAEDDDDIPF